MTTPPGDDPLVRYTDAGLARPLPARLLVARREVMAAVRELGTISDAVLTRPWPWKGGSEEEIRYGFYRIGEAFELAAIDAARVLRSAGVERGRAADLVGPATAARWDLQGLLVPLADAVWDADPGGVEWTVRQTLGHVIISQRYYGVGTAWWQKQGYRADDHDLPARVPEAIWDGLPSEEAEAEGTPADIRDRLDEVLDRSTELLAGMPEDRLGLGSRWSGFAVDLGFRLGRWSSHLREHTVQVEKTLVSPPGVGRRRSSMVRTVQARQSTRLSMRPRVPASLPPRLPGLPAADRTALGTIGRRLVAGVAELEATRVRIASHDA